MLDGKQQQFANLCNIPNSLKKEIENNRKIELSIIIITAKYTKHSQFHTVATYDN